MNPRDLYRRLSGVAVLASLLFISGCAFQKPPQTFLKYYRVGLPQLDAFEVCAMAGCEKVSLISYDDAEWRRLGALFEPASVSKEQERQRIAQAVALTENLIGTKNNTQGDLPRNQGFFATTPQLDCIAESANTTIALMLLEQQGWIRFHRIIYPRHRGLLDLQAPHNAASIEELDSGQQFVVDSWFYANGEKPIIVPVQRWHSGYDPEDS